MLSRSLQISFQNITNKLTNLESLNQKTNDKFRRTTKRTTRFFLQWNSQVRRNMYLVILFTAHRCTVLMCDNGRSLLHKNNLNKNP